MDNLSDKLKDFASNWSRSSQEAADQGTSLSREFVNGCLNNVYEKIENSQAAKKIEELLNNVEKNARPILEKTFLAISMKAGVLTGLMSGDPAKGIGVGTVLGLGGSKVLESVGASRL